MAGKEIRITLTGSAYGRKPKQRATLEALGLRRIGRTRVFKDGPVVRGMIAKVSHLVRVEKA